MEGKGSSCKHLEVISKNSYTTHLTQKILQHHANQEVQIFLFTLRTLVKPRSVYIWENH